MREKKMKTAYCLVTIAFLLASCSSSPSGDAIQTAIVQTQTAQPTSTIVPTDTPEPTNTPVPLGELDIESILLMPGDLPSNYKLSIFYKDREVHSTGPNLNKFPEPDADTSMDIDNTNVIDFWGNYEKSYVSIMLYNDLTQRDAAYGILIDPNNFFDTSVISQGDVGEKAVAVTRPMLDNIVIFTRCNALVYMRTTGDTANYAQRLDERLTPLVCR